MKKNTLRIITTILLVILIASTCTYVSASATGKPITPGDVQNNANYSTTDNTLMSTAGRIIGLIRNISAIAAVIIIMVLGVKYMMGSVEEKAEYKKSFMPLIIGIICVVAAASIASFIFNVAGN